MINLIPILQTAIGPAILISGVGLLLLTMTNRLGRVIDRARALDAQLSQGPESDQRRRLVLQLLILWQRARLIRLAIMLASASALSAALLIIVLFFTALGTFESPWLIGGLFILCMASLVSSLAVFIHDINEGLTALRHELSDAGMGKL
ncbi:MAG: DUF2721 domain-containing protein [Elusimicrobia bacterium]|nr:DUF2721 domain-containing protein [Elusimicrobiota bacterium]